MNDDPIVLLAIQRYFQLTGKLVSYEFAEKVVEAERRAEAN